MLTIRRTLLGVLWLTAASSWAQGVSSGTVQITVTPSVTRSLTVQLQGGTTSQYDFGAVNLGGGVHQGTVPFVVTNTGDVSLTYALQVSSEADLGEPQFPWNSIDTPGPGSLAGVTDKYRLLAYFNTVLSGAPDDPAYLVKRSAPTLAAPNPGQYATAQQSGANVTADPGGAGNQRLLWFDFKPPGYTTTSTQKRVSVTVIGQ